MTRAAVLLVLAGSLLPLALLAGCDDMIRQPKENAYRSESTGPGKVPNGVVRYAERPQAPPPLTYALIQHGQERFRQWCVPCHSELGNGLGMVVQRGFSPPPSYHIARLREAPTTHFYDVITNGYGAMYSFAERVPPYDRWAIASYIRALQRSTAGRTSDLSAEEQGALQ